jgi:YesN/AraC family two-component response regulator
MVDIELLKSVTVVYAEDDELIRESITRIIRRRVKEIRSAENGQEGLDLIEANMPDMVITDIEMPVMNGLEMIREVRERYGPNTPVIVVTAYQDEEHHSDLADGYIYKPIEAKDLFDLMAKLVKERVGR